MILMQDDDFRRSTASICFSLSYMRVPMRTPENMSDGQHKPKFSINLALSSGEEVP